MYSIDVNAAQISILYYYKRLKSWIWVRRNSITIHNVYTTIVYSVDMYIDIKLLFDVCTIYVLFSYKLLLVRTRLFGPCDGDMNSFSLLLFGFWHRWKYIIYSYRYACKAISATTLTAKGSIDTHSHTIFTVSLWIILHAKASRHVTVTHKLLQ